MSYFLNTQAYTALKEKSKVGLNNNPQWTYSMNEPLNKVGPNQIVGNIQTPTPDVSVLFKCFKPVRPNTPVFDNY